MADSLPMIPTAEAFAAGVAGGLPVNVDVLTQARMFEVTSSEDYTLALELVQTVVDPLLADVAEFFDERVGQAHALHKGLCDDRGKVRGPLLEARALFVTKATDWRTRQEELARQERARLVREAEERETAAKARAVLDSLFALAHYVAECTLRDEARAAESAAAATKGDTDKADAIAAEVGSHGPAPELPVSRPPAPSLDTSPSLFGLGAVPAVAGTAALVDWTWNVENMSAVICHVADEIRAGRMAHAGVLVIHEPTALQLAKAHKDRLGEVVPGLVGRSVPRTRVGKGRGR